MFPGQELLLREGAHGKILYRTAGLGKGRLPGGFIEMLAPAIKAATVAPGQLQDLAKFPSTAGEGCFQLAFGDIMSAKRNHAHWLDLLPQEGLFTAQLGRAVLPIPLEGRMGFRHEGGHPQSNTQRLAAA